MKRIILFSCILLIVLNVISQSTNDMVASVVNQQVAKGIVVDSTKIKAELLTKRHLKHKKFIQAADTLSKSDYLLSIDRVNDNLIDIRDSAKLGFEIVNVKQQIDDVTKDYNRMQLNFRERHIRMSVKNLTLYKTFATDLDDENDRIMDHLQKLYLRVYHAKLRVKTVLKDSIFKKMYADSLLRNNFEYKLLAVEHKWSGTDSITKLNIDSINMLKIKAVDNSINLTNMMSRLDRKLEKANTQLYGQELNSLWDILPNDSVNKTVSLFDSEKKAVSFYVSQTWQQQLFALVCGLLLFVWLFTKRKLLKTIRQQNEKYEFLNLKYLSNHPVLSILVIILCLMPFFDAYAPSSYVAIEYILLLSVASVILFKSGEPSLRFDWLVLGILFMVDVLTYLLAEPTFITRVWMLVLQTTVIVFTFRYYHKITKEMAYSNWIKAASITGMLLSMSAIIANLFGRFTLSSFLGTTGIFALTLAVILVLFVQSILEILVVQLLSSRLKKGVDKPFDCSVVISKIKMPILILAAILWLIVLASSLNAYHSISSFTVDALTDTRTIGSISFKLISVLMFFVIIWFAHILQRLLSFLFGETGIDNEDMTTINKGQHSRLLITRLLVLIGGYLLAIAASGLPIDKLTFLLGALGVGIGMGLQNVVNNFVSGIILIFDGSLQIGDEIEVSGQAGKVKEIGLRASTLNTADGAEVIIPNGNILSQNIVNWTFSNDQKRVTIEFSLKGAELDANLINEIINETIKNIPHVVEKRKPVILYNKVTAEGCSLTVRFWSTISKADTVKSHAMLHLNAAFAGKNIGFG
ncbi:MAG: mechanosensitive ion channel domain-containing protein [Paludibacter sp.]